MGHLCRVCLASVGHLWGARSAAVWRPWCACVSSANRPRGATDEKTHVPDSKRMWLTPMFSHMSVMHAAIAKCVSIVERRMLCERAVSRPCPAVPSVSSLPM